MDEWKEEFLERDVYCILLIFLNELYKNVFTSDPRLTQQENDVILNPKSYFMGLKCTTYIFLYTNMQTYILTYMHYIYYMS